jgi:hypothetical protein
MVAVVIKYEDKSKQVLKKQRWNKVVFVFINHITGNIGPLQRGYQSFREAQKFVCSPGLKSKTVEKCCRTGYNYIRR